MKKSPIKRLLALVVLVSQIPGLISLTAYKCSIKYGWFSPLGVYKYKLSIISILASYASTMLGLLAALAALLLVVANKDTFQQYRQRGYLNVFFWLYALSILTLIVMSLLIIPNFGNINTSNILLSTIVLFINSVFQIGLISLIVVNILRKSL